MEAIGGIATTRRRVQGPGFEVVGLGPDRSRTSALWLPAEAGLPEAALRVPVSARAFLERPGVVGLARMVSVDREARAVVYATGEAWSLTEVAASLRRRGRTTGLRAAVELAWAAADVLVRAHAEAQPLGLGAHGAVDPWRLGLRRDGQVVVLGYGMVAGRFGLSLPDGPELAEALRYAPPERVEGRDEDLSSDLFSLALVALEWMLGGPVYRGTVAQLRRQATEADGDRRLYAAREHLPSEVREVFGRAVRRDRDARWPDGQAFVAALRTVLASPRMDGPSLRQLMESADVDPPDRALRLDDVAPVAPASASAAPADDDDDDQPPSDGVDAGPARRWTSLGGRRAGPKGNRSATVPAQPVLPQSTADDAIDTQVPEDASPTAVPDEDTLDPNAFDGSVDDDSVADEAVFLTVEESTRPAPVSVALEEDVDDEPTLGTGMAPLPPLDDDDDDTDSLHMVGHGGEPAPARRDVVPDVSGEVTLSFAPRGTTSSDAHASHGDVTANSPTDTLARVRVREPGGNLAVHIFDARCTVAEASREVARAAAMPSTDLMGGLECAWVLGDDGEPLDDRLLLDDVDLSSSLELVRLPNRPCRIRVKVADGSDLTVDTIVGTAVPACDLVAGLLEIFGLTGRRWQLVVDGTPLPRDGLLHGRVRPGGVVELRK